MESEFEDAVQDNYCFIRNKFSYGLTHQQLDRWVATRSLFGRAVHSAVAAVQDELLSLLLHETP